MEAKIIVNAENAAVGRVASFVAGKLLKSKDEIAVVNSEKAIVTGNKASIMQDHLHKRTLLGGIQRGPHISRVPYMMLKRSIRGMLPRKKGRGQEALKRVKCYNGIPKEFEGKKMITFEDKTDLKHLPLGKVYQSW